MTEQSAPVSPQEAPRQWLPHLTSRWWSLLLGISLMANLLVGGLVLGHAFAPGRIDRLVGASYIQLIPRRFFFELPRERRDALMGIVKSNRDEFKQLRDDTDAAALKLAEDLEKEPFDIANVRNTISRFATGSESLAAKGGAVVVEIVSQLTADERKALAVEIRRRDGHANRRRKE